MMHRSKSKDRATTPGPTYMSPKQMAEYLHDLRSNRIPRPNGSRPLPPQFTSMSRPTSKAVDTPAISPLSHLASQDVSDEPALLPPRCSSAQSHRRTNSAMSNTSFGGSMAGRPLVMQPRPQDVSGSTTDSSRPPSIAYRENGHRLLEREEAKLLRKALEDIDLEEEQGLYADARDEAAELVWRHQNPTAPYPNPDAPYRYPGLSQDGAARRSRSLSREPQDPQRSNSKLRKRLSNSSVSASGGSRSSSLQSTVPSDSSMQKQSNSEVNTDSVRGRQPREPVEMQQKTSSMPSSTLGDSKHRRRSSGSKRKPSGSLFRNPDDQIYEEPEEETTSPPKSVVSKAPTTLPLQVRRNPFTRVQFAKEGLARSNTDPVFATKKFDRYEIQNNPPTQSRNAAYTSNSLPATPPQILETSNEGSEDGAEVKMKDGKEIRSDDIRAATSMKLKDRSPKLPTPTIVSDSPGRPIVSFQQDWKPKEIELKQEPSRPLPPTSSGTDVHADPTPRPLTKSATAPVVPTINFPDAPAPRIREQPSAGPKINVSQAPPIPTISVNGASTPPKINIQEPPSINVSPASVPAINAPSISVSPSSINAPSSKKQPSTRPLPTPKANSTRPLPRSTASAPPASTPHWTPATRRTTALCAQCALPIAGRIVSAGGSRFHPECFVCHHCGEGLECVAFYPEPENKRAERIDRIHRRMNGEDIEIGEGISEADDGDEGMRSYCHLDYHEFFSPRCKSCKTPIEGEVIVACGAEWHAGHFFCAQCGDPFDSTTPFVEKDGYAWCVGCHTNRYSTKCKKCRKPVTDTVVKALGAEWHTQCFCCMECGGQFDDGRYFLRGNSQDPVCVKCEERRLKA